MDPDYLKDIKLILAEKGVIAEGGGRDFSGVHQYRSLRWTSPKETSAGYDTCSTFCHN